MLCRVWQPTGGRMALQGGEVMANFFGWAIATLIKVAVIVGMILLAMVTLKMLLAVWAVL